MAGMHCGTLGDGAWCSKEKFVLRPWLFHPPGFLSAIVALRQVDDLLHRFQIAPQSAPTGGGDAISALGPATDEFAPARDIAGLFELAQMDAHRAVGHLAALDERGEVQ